jgi:hypothetical protein
VSHVDNKIGSHGRSYRLEAFIVHQATVCRCACDDEFGPVKSGILFEGVVVNDAGLEVDSEGESLKVGRYGRDPARKLFAKGGRGRRGTHTSAEVSDTHGSDGHHEGGRGPSIFRVAASMLGILGGSQDCH